MDRRLPLAVRKELLLARAAVERVELREAARDLRAARGRFAAITGFLSRPAGTGSGVVGALLGGLSLLRRHPYLGTAASIAIGATRYSRAGRWIRRVALLTALAAGGVWLAGRSRTPSRPAPPGQGAPDAANASASQGMQGSTDPTAGSPAGR